MKSPTNSDSRLRTLKSDFAAFRRRTRPRGRIPEQLRRGVLAAVAAGVEPAVITAELGVSGPQVATWRQRLAPLVVASCNVPRVLEVIPGVSKAGEPSGLRVSYEAGRLLLELSF